MRFLARFVFLIVLVLSPLLFAVSPAHAQYANPYIAPNTDANVPANLHTYTQSLVLEILSAFTCQIVGQDPLTQDHQCLGVDTKTGKIGYVPSDGGAIGFMGTMISALYTPPVDSVGYAHYVASNFGFVKHTYAASAPNGSSVSQCGANGCGFDKLTPLLGLWTTFRNVAYALFVVIFIAIGFAIMLRVQIDPRTVMTIENQIPKIIIALILVTFSYAIAGFMIDLMYASTYLTINVVASSQTSDTKYVAQIRNTERSDLTGGNPIGFANDIVPGGIAGIAFGSAGAVKDLVNNLFTADLVAPKDDTGSSTLAGAGGGALAGAGAGALIGAIFGGPIGAGIGAGIGAVVGLLGGAGIGAIAGSLDNIPQVVANAVGTLIGIIAGLLAFLVIAIAMLVALFRVWFTLLLTYVQILLDIVLAPFIIIFGVLPGSKIGFGSWFKGMAGNLLAFPVTVGMFLLAGVFMNNFATSSVGMFVPPLIGNPNGDYAGRSPVAYIIALGMVLLTPSVVTLTRGLVGAEDNKALAGIFQGLGVGGKTVGGIFKRTTGAIFGQEITYDDNGQIKPIHNPVEKLWRGFVGGH